MVKRGIYLLTGIGVVLITQEVIHRPEGWDVPHYLFFMLCKFVVAK